MTGEAQASEDNGGGIFATRKFVCLRCGSVRTTHLLKTPSLINFNRQSRPTFKMFHDRGGLKRCGNVETSCFEEACTRMRTSFEIQEVTAKTFLEDDTPSPQKCTDTAKQSFHFAQGTRSRCVNTVIRSSGRSRLKF